MALAKAVGLGAVGALAIPWLVWGGTGRLVEWLHYGLVHFYIADRHFAWSWPIFCTVTLFTWLLLKAAGDG
ncbi:MAG TPA: hypothetical protein VLK25_05835 [Allosphingosinicella sp.]|nr:hypothetical protein [Allosphingosinicella sp.]